MSPALTAGEESQDHQFFTLKKTLSKDTTTGYIGDLALRGYSPP
jgi:hypothetical protein